MKCTCANGLITSDCPEHVKQVATELLVDKADFAHQLSALVEEYTKEELEMTYPYSYGMQYTKPFEMEGFARWLKEYK